jgi:hypothetical protein
MILVSTSCRKMAFQMVYPTLDDGRYDSEFPYRNSSAELDKISKTVKKLYCLVEYDHYHFNEHDGLSQDHLYSIKLKSAANKKNFFTESVHGTATIIQSTSNDFLVLSCAHIVDYPDTILSYYIDEYNQPTAIIESVSVKRKQTNFIREGSHSLELDIVAMDEELDIAFLGNAFKELNHKSLPVFPYPVGNSKDLEWGSFVYIMGYPSGHQMVTRGIVSNPNITNKGEFIIDALFNQGISGGIVLAVRDGVPNFELVGIAKSVSVKYNNVLKPKNESHQELYNPNVPYTGDLFVKVEKEINYGVTFTVSIGTIHDFYKNNRSVFIAKGYNLDYFFENHKN